jgi:hypothetical protein
MEGIPSSFDIDDKPASENNSGRRKKAIGNVTRVFSPAVPMVISITTPSNNPTPSIFHCDDSIGIIKIRTT